MARALTTNMSAAIAETQGLEPVVLLKINWPGQQWFATKPLDGYENRILEFSGLRTRVDLQGTSSVSIIQFVLDDYDGMLKTLMNITELEQTSAEVYIYYDGLAGTATDTQVFEGKITNPITWDEGQRKLTLNIESDLKSKKVGFTIKSGQFSVNNEIAVGQLWPIIFGKPAHVKAVLAEKQPADFLRYSVNMGGAIGQSQLYNLVSRNFEDDQYVDLQINNWDTIASHTVDLNDIIAYDKIWLKDGSSFAQQTDLDLIIDGVIFNGQFGMGGDSSNVFTISEANAPKYREIGFQARLASDDDFNNPHVAWIDTNYISLVDHYVHFLPDENADVFFNGEERIIRKIVRQDGTKIWFDRPLKADPKDDLVIFSTTTAQIDEVRALAQSGLKVDVNTLSNTIKRILEARANRTKNTSGNAYGQFITQLQILRFIRNAFWEAPEDTEVRVWQSNPDIYVCNSVESNSIDSVWGVRRFGDQRVFVQIPSHYYTKNLNESTNIDPNEGPATVTTLRFIEPLDSMKDQGWEDDIYVTLESTLSDNPATIIKYILDTYTGLTTDTSSFNTVAGELGGYDCHFNVNQEWDAIDLCRNIAFQAGIGLIFEGAEVKCINLMKEPTSIVTISESNTEFQSIRQYDIPSIDLITQYNGRWRETGEPDLDQDRAYNKRLQRIYTIDTNINKFGLTAKDVDFYIYNAESPVDAVLDFWSARFGNSWRILECVMFHDTIQLEPFDKVTVNFSSSLYVGVSSCKGIVIGVNNPVTTGQIRYKFLLNVKSGETSADSNFWNYQNISAPTNPASSLFETSYDVQIEKEPISLDTFIARLHALNSGITTLGKVNTSTPITNTYDDMKTVDIHHEGVLKDPEGQHLAPIGNPNFDLYDREPVKLTVTEDGAYRINDKFAVIQAKVVSIDDNYLTCHMYDNASGTEIFYVAKPYHLRRTTYDGQMIDGKEYAYEDAQTRLNLTDAETQEIIIKYHVGDIIYVGYIPNGTDTVDANEDPIHYIDINVDGRTWAGECT